MLIRPHDDGGPHDDRWRRFVAEQGFGHLVASGRDRALPVVVPTQFLLEGDHVVLHLAVGNPMFAALAENDAAVLSVAGDWAYIPGAWKAIGSEDPRAGIPTTFYAAVQLAGTAAVLDDPEAVAAVLRRQLGALERGHDYLDPTEHGSKLRAIRAIDLTVTDVRAKFKFGGNLDHAHREHIAARLGERRGPGDAAVLTHLAGG